MAASRIKGITVEIGGDTTKLQTALKGVNSEIKNTQSQFKDVEKLLKLDPDNTELLAQKQKLLSSAVSETKEKLATLKIAAEQANQALANGDISKEQYDALQREIIETEEDLKKLEAQANQSATAVVTALGVAAVKTASDFDSSMSQVAAVSGATGEDFDKLRAKAREMGAKTKFSASEAADAMNYMAMAGWKTSDMLDGIEGIMNLAAASGEDLATTSDIPSACQILEKEPMQHQKHYLYTPLPCSHYTPLQPVSRISAHNHGFPAPVLLLYIFHLKTLTALNHKYFVYLKTAHPFHKIS